MGLSIYSCLTPHPIYCLPTKSLYIYSPSRIFTLNACACVHACLCKCVWSVHVCVPSLGVCLLIEFFSHRSMWQVALLASSECSVQVLSWVRICHIHLHEGTMPPPPPLKTQCPPTLFLNSFTILNCETVSSFFQQSLLCAQISWRKSWQTTLKFIGKSVTALRNNISTHKITHSAGVWKIC